MWYYGGLWFYGGQFMPVITQSASPFNGQFMPVMTQSASTFNGQFVPVMTQSASPFNGQFMIGPPVAPTGMPCTCGNVYFTFFPCYILYPYSYGLVNFHQPSNEVCSSYGSSPWSSSDDVCSSSESSPPWPSTTRSRNGLYQWLESINVEECQNLNQLLLLKEQLEGTIEKLSASPEDADSFRALFL